VRGFPVEVSPEAAAVHEAALVLDLHNDVLTKLTHMPGYDFTRAHAPAAFYNPLRLDLDLPRIRRGGIDALGCLLFAGFKLDRSRRRFWRQLDCARQLAASHPDAIALCRTTEDIRAARAAGRLALFLGVEGSYAIDEDIAAGVARLAEAGVRFVGPLWERDSQSGTSCRTRADRDRGLTDHGRTLVRACNDAGLLLDVAHASKKTFWDMMEVSMTPPFSSHSGADGVHPHPRNLDDAQIRALADRGGIVGVIFVAAYLGGPFCTLERVADHIEHVARVGGDDCVALGSDFDGFMPLPRGLRDAADLPRLTELLWRRGWREARLTKLLGGNAIRYLAQG
jgi:membrane dipeptidase